MKLLVLVDEKPCKCDNGDCIFWIEDLEKTENANVLNIYERCFWGKEYKNENCPLTEGNVIFNYEKENV